jgi:hypothetical protein
LLIILAKKKKNSDSYERKIKKLFFSLFLLKNQQVRNYSYHSVILFGIIYQKIPILLILLVFVFIFIKTGQKNLKNLCENPFQVCPNSCLSWCFSVATPKKAIIPSNK